MVLLHFGNAQMSYRICKLTGAHVKALWCHQGCVTKGEQQLTHVNEHEVFA